MGDVAHNQMGYTMDDTTSNAAAGLGVGGLVGGGLLGLMLGSILNGNGNGLFGNNNGNCANGPAVALGALEFMEQAGDIKQAICCAGAAGVAAANENRVTAIESAGNIMTAQAANNFTTLTSINGLGRDVISGLNQAQLQTLNSFNGVLINTQQGFNAQAMQAARDASAIQTTLQQMAMVNAQCCCDIKKAICDDGQATRALINDIRLAELQTELADAKNSLSNANQTLAFDAKMSAMASSIIMHLKPYPVVPSTPGNS